MASDNGAGRAVHRVFFHIKRMNDFIVDPEGCEVATIKAAVDGARASILEIAAECLQFNEPFHTLSIQICSSDGDLLEEISTEEVLSNIINPLILWRQQGSFGVN